MRYVSTFLGLLIFATAAWGQIEGPIEVEDNKLGIFHLAQELPEGVYLADGGWAVVPQDIDDQADTYEDQHVLVMTGDPGKYVIEFDAVMLKDVKFKDGDGNEVVIKSYVGRIKTRHVCEFKGTDDGDDDDDDPDPPSGPWQIMLFYDADQFPSYPKGQQDVLRSDVIRQRLLELGHTVLEVYEADKLQAGVPAHHQPFVEAVRGDSMPRIAISPRNETIAADGIVDVPLPSGWEPLLSFLNDPALAVHFGQYLK